MKILKQEIDYGIKFQIMINDEYLTCCEFFKLLGNDDFNQFFINILKPIDFHYFLEMNGFSLNKEQIFEFVIIKTDSFNNLITNGSSFEKYLKNKIDAISFTSPSGTILLIPGMLKDKKTYLDISNFIKYASKSQIVHFFKKVSDLVLNCQFDKIYVSTHGLDVHYLHLRISETPRYYSYTPYIGKYKIKKIKEIKKCIVFEFDSTLTFSNWFYFIEDYDRWLKDWTGVPKSIRQLSKKIREKNFIGNFDRKKIINYIFGSEDRLDNIIEFLENIHSKDYDIFITTKGHEHNVQLLIQVFNLPHIQKIYAEDVSEEYIIQNLHDEGYDVIYMIDENTKFKFFKGLNGDGLNKTMMKNLLKDI